MFYQYIKTLFGFRILAAMLSFIATFMIQGCQPSVYLMPTPLALTAGMANTLTTNPDGQKRTNEVSIFYATNRDPSGSINQRTYIKTFSQDIRVGTAISRFGGKDVDWETLYADSLKKKRSNKYKIYLEKINEWGVIKADDNLRALPPAAKQFITEINTALEDSLNKDILVYVHGANNNFYRSSSQAAQFQHFIGKNAVVVLFAWPSAENLLKYRVDLDNAAHTAGALARLIELLGLYTKAEALNIIGYSAGASVLSPALVKIRKTYPDSNMESIQKKLRIGQIYFASPDIVAKDFLKQLPQYLNITENVTVTANMLDSVLHMADSGMDESRLGKPNSEEFTLEELQWIKDKSFTDHLDIISMSDSSIPGPSGAHDVWYNNPWVSSDVIAQLISHKPPVRRGLVEGKSEHGLKIWYYPKDYPERLAKVIKQYNEKQKNK